MLAAGAAWGVYSVRGQSAGDPLRVTAGNFLRAIPMSVGLSACLLGSASADSIGVIAALASGALASGLGYAIWYTATFCVRAARLSSTKGAGWLRRRHRLAWRADDDSLLCRRRGWRISVGESAARICIKKWARLPALQSDDAQENRRDQFFLPAASHHRASADWSALYRGSSRASAISLERLPPCRRFLDGALISCLRLPILSMVSPYRHCW
jgi:hypothetical protein